MNKRSATVSARIKFPFYGCMHSRMPITVHFMGYARTWSGTCTAYMYTVHTSTCTVGKLYTAYLVQFQHCCDCQFLFECGSVSLTNYRELAPMVFSDYEKQRTLPYHCLVKLELRKA